jgi:aryl-alcohol dehydrogenase-like predicted oxidoreductase
LLTTSIAGIEVGRIGLGCFALSGGYGPADDGTAVETIHAALELGVNLLDTSDAYAAGENERLVGRAVAGKRDRAVITTKFGWILDSNGKAVARDSSPAHVREACEASLKRLGTDYIDLYIQHRVDPAVPVEATIGELARLQDEGKIRAFGLSEAGVDTITRAHQVSPLAALQTEYSLWSRDPELELLPLCKRLGITFIAYSPLGRGFLTGRVRTTADLPESDMRRTHPRFAEENLQWNLALVERLKRLAQDRGCTAAQLALAWIVAQPWGAVPIPATRRAEHLRSNVASLDIHLSATDLELIESAIPKDLVRGARHPADHMKTIES